MKQIIHFTATWCKPCEKMIPIIDEFIINNNDIEYVKIDVDEELETVKFYNILSVPTFIFSSDNKQKRHSGILSKDQLSSMFD